MCDKCREQENEAQAYANILYDWGDAQTDLPDMPDSLVRGGAITADLVTRGVPDPIRDKLGDFVMATVHLAFLAGFRAAREADVAPNGEGTLSEVFFQPVQTDN